MARAAAEGLHRAKPRKRPPGPHLARLARAAAFFDFVVARTVAGLAELVETRGC